MSLLPEIEAVILVPAVTVNVCVSAESTSETARLRVRSVSSLVDWLPIAVKTGASLISLIVIVTV